jgi:hypothetical protein
MSQCSIIHSFVYVGKTLTLQEIGAIIKSDKNKYLIEEIRFLVSEGKIEEAERKKKLLPGFTPSGTFKNRRSQATLLKYNSFNHFDFDDLTPIELRQALKIIQKIAFTFMCFISPSGKGLKVFVKVNTGAELHELAYLQVMRFYENATGLKADPSCRDISRLCYMSWDPDIYMNFESSEFLTNEFKNDPNLAIGNDFNFGINLSADGNLIEAVRLTEQKMKYVKGNRNNFIYFLACNSNRLGIPESNALEFALNAYDLKQRRIKSSFRSAYKHHKHEFAKIMKQKEMEFQNYASVAHESNSVLDNLLNTPTIPDEVFERLPEILKKGTGVFPDRRKRDVYFTGAVVAISACLPRVFGVYSKEVIYAHLYAIITAASASGKGALRSAKRLLNKHHQNTMSKSLEEKELYEREIENYNEKIRSRKKGEGIPSKPKKPMFKTIFVPANCSYTRMIDLLYQSGEEGVIIETEADIMSGANKQDWGDYSPLLRSAFQHESISFSRKNNNEYIVLNQPKLAIVLSGTPSQIPKLISSSEDGLFSRFLFYAFKNDIFWQDPSPGADSIIYNDHFDALGESIVRMIDFLEKSPTEIKLTDLQWEAFNQKFENTLSDVTIFTSEEASGIVYRLGVIMFRFCMIFSALRKFENGELTEVIYCSDEDFHNAVKLLETYLQHSILMYNNLPKKDYGMNFRSGDNKRKFFDALPEEFSRKEAVALGPQFNLKERSVDGFLKIATGVSLSKLSNGLYKKIVPKKNK